MNRPGAVYHMRGLVLLMFVIIIVNLLSYPITFSAYLSGFRDIIGEKMEWFRLIQSNGSEIDIYGRFGGYGKSLVVLLVDDLGLYNQSIKLINYILNNYNPPAIVIASNLATSFEVIEEKFNITIDAYRNLLVDKRYGFFTPVSTFSFETVFLNTIGFIDVHGNSVINYKILGNASVYDGEKINTIPVFLEVNINRDNKYITLFLIGSPYLFLTLDPYLDHSLYYNDLRNYIVLKAKNMGAKGVVLIDDLRLDLFKDTIQVETEKVESSSPSYQEDGNNVQPKINIPFIRFVPPNIGSWNVFISIPTSLVILIIIFFLIIIIQLYMALFLEPHSQRIIPKPYKLREVHESSSHKEPSKFLVLDDIHDFIILLSKGEKSDVLIIESYNFLNKLLREKIGFNIRNIIKDKRALAIASETTQIEEQKLLDMLNFLHKVYISIISGDYMYVRDLSSILNKVLIIVSTIAKRLKVV